MNRLEEFGYLPGRYMKRCGDCEVLAFDISKYASRCENCAKKLSEGAPDFEAIANEYAIQNYSGTEISDYLIKVVTKSGANLMRKLWIETKKNG